MYATNYTIVFAILASIFVYCLLTSHKFRYYTKFTFYISICAVASIIVLPISLCRPKDVRNIVFLSKLCQIISPIIGIEWVIQGTENIPKDEACIIMANHQTGLDVLGMFHLWPILKRATAVAKQELIYAIPFGTCLWLCGVLFIPRSQGEKSKKILNDTLETVKKEKKHVWIFPEGTRRNDGQIHEFKKGGFHMALSAHLPVLPIVYSTYDFINSKEKQFGRGKVMITILPPISTKGKSLENMDSLILETRSKMIETFHQINNNKTK